MEAFSRSGLGRRGSSRLNGLYLHSTPLVIPTVAKIEHYWEGRDRVQRTTADQSALRAERRGL